MNEIIEGFGTNQYKIPHLSKAKLERARTLPSCLEVTPFAAGMIVSHGSREIQPAFRNREDAEEPIAHIRAMLPMEERLTREEFGMLQGRLVTRTAEI